MASSSGCAMTSSARLGSLRSSHRRATAAGRAAGQYTQGAAECVSWGWVWCDGGGWEIASYHSLVGEIVSVASAQVSREQLAPIHPERCRQKP